MNENELLEKWIKQIQRGQLNPDALGLGPDKDKAIEKLKSEINKISSKSKLVTIK
jgi:hypothetical protein